MKENMNQIVAVYKASETPAILNPIVRRRMSVAAKEWDCDCAAYWVGGSSLAGASTPAEMVVECPSSLLDQKEKLIRRVEAAMKGGK